MHPFPDSEYSRAQHQGEHPEEMVRRCFFIVFYVALHQIFEMRRPPSTAGWATVPGLDIATVLRPPTTALARTQAVPEATFRLLRGR